MGIVLMIFRREWLRIYSNSIIYNRLAHTELYSFIHIVHDPNILSFSIRLSKKIKSGRGSCKIGLP